MDVICILDSFSRKPGDMPDALRHTHKIILKPKAVGTEFKNLVDIVTAWCHVAIRNPGKEK